VKNFPSSGSILSIRRRAALSFELAQGRNEGAKIETSVDG